MMKLSISALAVCAGLASFSATPINAAALTLDGGWSAFSFGDVGSTWSDSFSFTIASSAFFAVTDAYLSGDRFSFYDGATLLGLTSAPGSLGDQIWGDFDGAYADSRWSSGQIELAAGSYTITGLTVLSPFGSGTAAVQLSSRSLGGPTIQPPATVPLPASALLLLGGLGGLLSFRRRRSA